MTGKGDGLSSFVFCRFVLKNIEIWQKGRILGGLRDRLKNKSYNKIIGEGGGIPKGIRG